MDTKKSPDGVAAFESVNDARQRPKAKLQAEWNFMSN